MEQFTNNEASVWICLRVCDGRIYCGYDCFGIASNLDSILVPKKCNGLEEKEMGAPSGVGEFGRFVVGEYVEKSRVVKIAGVELEFCYRSRIYLSMGVVEAVRRVGVIGEMGMDCCRVVCRAAVVEGARMANTE